MAQPYYKVYVKPSDRARSGHNSFADARRHAHKILEQRRTPASAFVVEVYEGEERNVYGVARTRSGSLVVGFDTHEQRPAHQIRVSAGPRSRISPLAERVVQALAPARRTVAV